MTTAKKRVASKVLPMVPSELINIAIKDMRKALAKGWIINMGNWYDPKTKVICSVDDEIVIEEYTVCSACAAGSVMALSLAKSNQLKGKLGPEKFKANAKQLRAIDDLRQGSMSGAADELDLVPNGLHFGTQYEVIRS